jgi:hypothetical protein
MLHIPDVLEGLKDQRPVFHSEADFQHVLAWEIHRRHPQASVRLERPILRGGRLIYLDLWVSEGSSHIAIELKYKTRPLEITIGDESFHLRSHGAQDLGRYDFLKDVYRVEQVVAEDPNAVGYAILLTNDSTYWTVPRDVKSIDAAFRLTDGRSVSGHLAWGVTAGAGTMRGREQPILLKKTYLLQWSAYSKVEVTRNHTFRSCVVRVET